jgi:phytanoyl-CoA hydroxylase
LVLDTLVTGHMPTYRSRFGGLWYDKTDQDAIDAQLRTIRSARLRERVGNFIRDGYVIIPRAVDHAVIDRYLVEYEAAADQPDGLKLEGKPHFTRELSHVPGAKVVDSGMLLPSGGDLAFAPPITQTLVALLQDKALAFQTLHFEVGSTQAVHQDTAYVVVDTEPMQLVASWIALEDVQPGSGELIFYRGGHRMAEHAYFAGNSKHWNPERDGNLPHDVHLRSLHENARKQGLKLERFLPRKGDALLWHADLPHGGGEITKPGTTRRSMVVHYTTLANEPHYTAYIPESWRRKVDARDGHAFISMHFPPERFAALQDRPVAE